MIFSMFLVAREEAARALGFQLRHDCGGGVFAGWSLRILVCSLPGGEVSVQLLCGFENGHTGESFDDLKNFLDLGLKMDEGGVPTPFVELPARDRKNPQPGAADEFEASQVENEMFDSTGQHGSKLPVQFW
jgi:hypothetical protein